MAAGAVIVMPAMTFMAIVVMVAVLAAFALPVGLGPAPAAVGTHPAARRVVVVGARTLPVALAPAIGVLMPLPVARHPDIADARRRHALEARRRRRHGDEA